jgi:predicted nucleic acid-binding protein
MRVVLDASMALSFVLADEFNSQSRRTLAAIALDGAVVPALWDFEVLNGLVSAERRGRLTAAAMTNAIHGLQGLPIERDGHLVDGLRLTSLAREFDLSVYDAAYLALALDADLPLASLDSRLASAAKAAGARLAKKAGAIRTDQGP